VVCESRNLAHPEHPATAVHFCACLEGVVYIGHLVEEDGQETEIVEAVMCKHCKMA
jgi:hypothetical protein